MRARFGAMSRERDRVSGSLVQTGLGGRARSPEFPDSLAMQFEDGGHTSSPSLSFVRLQTDEGERGGGGVTPVHSMRFKKIGNRARTQSPARPT